IVVFILSLAGCSTTNPSNSGNARLSEEELREKLSGFYVNFVNSVEAATANAGSQTDDLELKRRLIEGRIRVTRSCRQLVFQQQPMRAFVDTWCLCMQIGFRLDSPAAKEELGAAQPELLTAVQGLQTDMEGLGRL